MKSKHISEVILDLDDLDPNIARVFKEYLKEKTGDQRAATLAAALFLSTKEVEEKIATLIAEGVEVPEEKRTPAAILSQAALITSAAATDFLMASDIKGDELANYFWIQIDANLRGLCQLLAFVQKEHPDRRPRPLDTLRRKLELVIKLFEEPAGNMH